MAKAEYRNAIRSKKLIKEAMADLLLEKPLDKITVSDVVRRAEINRGTFYAHYADIPDVINHLIEETFSHIRDAIDEQPRQLAEVPKLLLFRIQAILESDLDFYRKVMTSSASALLYEQLIGIVLEHLYQHEEEYSVGDHRRFAIIMSFCAGGLSNLYRDWFSGNLPLSLDELTVRATEMLQRSIAEE